MSEHQKTETYNFEQILEMTRRVLTTDPRAERNDEIFDTMMEIVHGWATGTMCQSLANEWWDFYAAAHQDDNEQRDDEELKRESEFVEKDYPDFKKRVDEFMASVKTMADDDAMYERTHKKS